MKEFQLSHAFVFFSNVNNRKQPGGGGDCNRSLSNHNIFRRILENIWDPIYCNNNVLFEIQRISDSWTRQMANWQIQIEIKVAMNSLANSNSNEFIIKLKLKLIHRQRTKLTCRSLDQQHLSSIPAESPSIPEEDLSPIPPEVALSIVLFLR